MLDRDLGPILLLFPSLLKATSKLMALPMEERFPSPSVDQERTYLSTPIPRHTPRQLIGRVVVWLNVRSECFDFRPKQVDSVKVSPTVCVLRAELVQSQGLEIAG